MEIEAFLLCDAATDSFGKLNVLGAFDNISAKQLPIVHPACAIAARMRFSSIEQGQHNIRMNIIDIDGNPVLPKFEGNIVVNFQPESESRSINFVFNLQRLKFDKFGKFRIDLAIDNNHKASLPFSISEIKS